MKLNIYIQSLDTIFSMGFPATESLLVKLVNKKHIVPQIGSMIELTDEDLKRLKPEDYKRHIENVFVVKNIEYDLRNRKIIIYIGIKEKS